MNIQDLLLNQLRKEKIKVTLHTINNETLEGFIKSFDSFCILFQNENALLLVYKHAIKYITTPKEITQKLFSLEKDSGRKN